MPAFDTYCIRGLPPVRIAGAFWHAICCVHFYFLLSPKRAYIERLRATRHGQVRPRLTRHSFSDCCFRSFDALEFQQVRPSLHQPDRRLRRRASLPHFNTDIGRALPRDDAMPAQGYASRRVFISSFHDIIARQRVA